MITNCYKYVLLAFLWAVEILTPQQQQDIYNKYLLSSWETPNNYIRTIVQSRTGYLWIGTAAGLARFDGVKFKNFNHRNSSLTIDNILSLYEDINGVLWVGTDGGGLYRFNKDKTKLLSAKTALSNNHILSLAGDWRGNLWVGTEYGLNRLGKRGKMVITTKDGLLDNIITALETDNWGNLWIGTLRGGLAQYHDKIVRIYGLKEGLSSLAINTLKATPGGVLWIGTMEGLCYLSPETKSIQPVRGTSYTPITSINLESKDKIWAGTMVDGLMLIEGKEKKTTFIVPGDHVVCLNRDYLGNLWLGTNGNGLMRLRKRLISNLAGNNSFQGITVNTVLQDRHKSLWIGTRNRGLVKMGPGPKTTVYDINSGLAGNRIKTLYEDRLGRLWVGIENKGLNIIYKNTTTRFSLNDDLTSKKITAITQSNDDALWIGTDNGLNRVVGSRLTKIDSKTDGRNQHIRVLLTDKNRRLHVGTKTGLFQVVDLSLLKKYPGPGKPDVDVMAIFEEEDGSLLLGINGHGLIKWNSSGAKSLTENEGLPDNHLFSIVKDDSGCYWVSSYTGAFKINGEALKAFYDGRLSRIIPVIFDQNDGMGNSHCVAEGEPSAWLTDDGSLLVPTINGVSVFDTRLPIPEKRAPSPIIEDVTAGGHAIRDNNGVYEFGAGKKLVIGYTAPDFNGADKTRFKYKLEGYDSDFIYPATNEARTVIYNDLDSGIYFFHLFAAGKDGKCTKNPANIKIVVIRPFYLHQGFYLLMMVPILFLLTLVVFLNQKKKQRKRDEKYKTSALDNTKANEIKPNLIRLLEEDKVFLNPDLTLKDLAQKLRLHYNHLSQIINADFGMSYSDFINKYRIEEAQKKLRLEKDKNITEIMYDSGFYSKSVFNTAFKKFTGTTPSAFRKSLKQDRV